jgi:hypothetical protein
MDKRRAFFLFFGIPAFLTFYMFACHDAVSTAELIIPWHAIGGCGPAVPRDSLYGRWKWVESCPVITDATFACENPALLGFNKYLFFGQDSVFSYKNLLLVGVARFDSTVFGTNKTTSIPDVGNHSDTGWITIVGGATLRHLDAL